MCTEGLYLKGLFIILHVGGLTPEEELKRAQDDTSALKSIVEPLGKTPHRLKNEFFPALDLIT